MTPRVRWGGLGLTLALYGCALWLSAAEADVGPDSVSFQGYELVAMGPEIPGALSRFRFEPEVLSFIAGWCANPLIALTAFAFLINRPRLALLAGLPAVVLVLSVLPFWWSTVACQPGYWCWAASAAIGLISFRAARRPTLTDLRSDYGPPIVTQR
jgi:hypothetical protein